MGALLSATVPPARVGVWLGPLPVPPEFRISEMLSEILKEVNKFTSYRGVPISHLRKMSSRLHGNTIFPPK